MAARLLIVDQERIQQCPRRGKRSAAEYGGDRAAADFSFRA